MKLTGACASLLIAQTVAASYVCNSTTVTKTGLIPKADFMFLIDASGSMCEKIKGVVSGLKKFANKIQSSDIDAQYGLVVFGGRAELKLQLTSNHGKLISNLEKVGCKNGGQEASFEAMRMLFKNNGADLLKNCDSSVNSACGVFWRTNATKVIMHATDEDSDLPVLASYRVANQTQASSFCARFYSGKGTNECQYGDKDRYEPPFTPAGFTNRIVIQNGKFFQQPTLKNMYRTGNDLKLSQGFENEIAQTAKILLQNGVIVNSLVGLIVGTEEQAEKDMLGLLNPLSSFSADGNYYFAASNNPKKPFKEDMLTTATYQFGHPSIQIQDPQTFANFDTKKTLQKLNQLGLKNSLQSRILTGNGFMRIFDIDAFAGDKNSKVIDAFYDQMVKTTTYVQKNCIFVPDPVTSTSTSTTSTKSTTSSTTSKQSTSSSSVKSTTSSSSSSKQSSSSTTSKSSSSSKQTSSSTTSKSTTSSTTSNTATTIPTSTKSTSSTTSSKSTSSSSTLKPTTSTITSITGSTNALTSQSSNQKSSSTPTPTAGSQTSTPVSNLISSTPPFQTQSSGGQTSIPSLSLSESSSSSEDSQAYLSITTPSQLSTYDQETAETTTSEDLYQTTSSEDITDTPTAEYTTSEYTTTLEVSSEPAFTSSDYELQQTTTEELTSSTTVPTLVPVVSIVFDEPPVITPGTQEENDSNPPVDDYPPSMESLIIPFLPKTRGGSAGKVDVVLSQSQTSTQSLVTIIVNDDPLSDSAQTSSPGSPSSTAAIAILAPAAAIASAFGLFMLRKSRAVARDIKFAFGADQTTAGQNPLYASQFKSHDNPLFTGSQDINLASRDNLIV